MIASHRGLLTITAIALLAGSAYCQLGNLLNPVAAETSAVTDSSPRTPQIRAGTPSYVLTAEAFAAAIEKDLGARLALNGELKLTLAQSWKPLKLPASDFAVIISETPAGGIAGTFVVRTKIMSGGQLASDLQIALQAQLWQEVWAAASRLERGQPLDRSLLTTAKVDALRERQPPLPTDVDPSTMEMAQAVGASRTLTRRDVMERPLVRRGQVVEVVGQQGLLAISMKALALENGANGDLIKLRNLDSRKEFSGQILNEKKVQIHF